jgi:hypothetical protein
MAERGDSRWAGRNGAKAAIRDRVWSGLVEAQVNIGPVFERIPNFVGADVNIGDCLMRWTNDVYVSTPHRVVNRSARERYSIAFFFDPNSDAMVEAIPSCVREGELARYPAILAAGYLKMRLDASKPTEADRSGV